MENKLKILFVIVCLALGFYVLNNYIYKEKQGDGLDLEIEQGTGVPTFTWRYEKTNTLNLDGIPNTNIFLELKYKNEVKINKLIDTVPGSCNDLPDREPDSVENSTNIICYSAGLGYRFKIVEGNESYLVFRKTFEEALPDYNPPLYEYQKVAEFLFVKNKFSTMDLVDGRQCYTYNHEATTDAPYKVDEFIDITISGNSVIGNKTGTQSGPDMTNGYTGTLTGTLEDNTISVVFAYTVEGSKNKEKEIYKANETGIEKLRYPLIDQGDILVPDMTKEFQKLSYARVSCVGSN